MGTEGQTWHPERNIVCLVCEKRYTRNGFHQHYRGHFPDREVTDEEVSKALERGLALFLEGTPEPQLVCPECGFVGAQAELIEHLVKVEDLTLKKARNAASTALDPVEAVERLTSLHAQKAELSRMSKESALSDLPVIGRALEAVEQELAIEAKRLTPRKPNNPKKP